MTTTNPKTGSDWKIGDRYFQGHGLIRGRDVDDSATDPCKTREEADKAIRAEWLAWVDRSDRDDAEVYVREMEVCSIDGDGQIGSAVSVD